MTTAVTATYAQTVTGSTQTNIKTVGTLTSLTSTGTITVNYTPATAVGSAILATGSNTQGGVTYFDFLRVTNSSSTATNASKSFRINNLGTLEIVSSAYTATIFSVTDNGYIAISQAQGVSNGVPGNNAIAMNSNSYIYDDGNYHLTSKSGSIWLNANDGSAVNINTQVPVGTTPGGLNVQGTITSQGSGTAVTSFISGQYAYSGIALQMSPNGTGAANQAIRDTSSAASTMYFDINTGGSANGTFKWRSSNSFTELMVLNSTQLTINEPVAMGGSGITAYLNVIGSKSYTVTSYGYLSTSGSGTGGNSGNVGYGIYCANRIQSGEVDVTSDERAKDIQGTIPLDKALQFVREVDGILYTWRPGFGDEGLKSGFSAQKVHKAGFDHMIGHIPNEQLEGTVDDDGWTHPDKFQLTMGYNQAIPYHHEVIKNLLARIETLEATVAALTKG